MLKSSNDGKGKSQSFEVWSDTSSAREIPSGYGSTQEEALKEYQENADRYIQDLQDYNRRFIKGRAFI